MRKPNQGQLTVVKMRHLQTTITKLITWAQVHELSFLLHFAPKRSIPYYRKLTLHEIKVLEINANLMANDFRIKKSNAKEEVEFHDKGN